MTNLERARELIPKITDEIVVEDDHAEYTTAALDAIAAALTEAHDAGYGEARMKVRTAEAGDVLHGFELRPDHVLMPDGRVRKYRVGESHDRANTIIIEAALPATEASNGG